MDCEVKDRFLDDTAIKKLSKLMPNHRAVSEMCKKIAFSHFLSHFKGSIAMTCCEKTFEKSNDMKKHISIHHSHWITDYATEIEKQFYNVFNEIENQQHNSLNGDNLENFETDPTEKFICSCKGNFKVTLYYLYTNIKVVVGEISWQRSICKQLNLTGKIRVAIEGINGTAEGCECAIEEYILSMCHRFPQMEKDDFKLSDGNGNSFRNLRVSDCEELCSIGIPPNKLKPTDGGKHLTPEQFHRELHKKAPDTVLLDCRNFYESKIGYFEDALRPDLRKFSYFPAYVDKNQEIFKDKRVLMYCTGGIRCERASAYIKNSVDCKEVLQLKGGIHKYLEKYPNGHYKGKLFVFDERYSIGGETHTPVSSCKYCNQPHDQYKLCTTPSCRQLVLSCDECRMKGRTACCSECQSLSDSHSSNTKQVCECTKTREQIPIENKLAS